MTLTSVRQFKAGYITDTISRIVKNKFENESIFFDLKTNSNELNYLRGLLKHTSTFDVQFPVSINVDYNQINPVLASLNNIITRGLPTKAPILIENKFVEIGLIQSNAEPYEFNFKKCVKNINYDTIFELFHIMDPHLEISKENYGGSLGSHLEWEFVSQHPFLIQILQSQRSFASINPTMCGGRSVDFSFTSPYLHWNNFKNSFENKTRIFEVDGPHHLVNDYIFYDHNRDIAAAEVDADTFRFTVQDVEKNEIKFEKLIENKIYKVFEKNFKRSISDYLMEYTLVFVPIAVARIQKTIIEYLILHQGLFKKEVLQIAIIERDIPGAGLAIKSLEEYCFNINAILEDEDKLSLPRIELSIFQENKWVIDERINCGFEVKNENFFGTNDFDIIIDHSILKRSNIYKESTYTLREAIVIRSCHYVDNATRNSRKAYCSKLLNYKQLVKRNEDGSYTSVKELEQHINFFIQNIFRKIGFREGQLPIISRALQQLPVIGLLPTGGGKSLTFQLPAFLQPGLCIVVDPIKSLMEDQVRVLKENWIDCCEYINSTISSEEKRKRIIDFRLGESLFFFVSPERFIMDDFRKVVSNIHGSNFGLGFSYCVIDEVHCVSEWGHDFRYTYLMLGINAQKFCSTRNLNKKVALIGLTATASFDVLTDIERELQIEHSDVANAVIMIENTIRPELFFRIIDVTNKSRIDSLNEDFLNLNNNLIQLNDDTVLKQSQLHHFTEFEPKDFAKKNEVGEYILENGKYQFKYNKRFLIATDLRTQNTDDFYTITFCPVRGTKLNMYGEYINKSGVRYVNANLSSNSKGFYYASDSDLESEEVHDHFTQFTSGSEHHMVCTKAFGMGIDKTDIRSTYHYNYSSSLESFIQECGRAGRDKKIALANILFDTSKAYHFNILSFFEGYPSITSFERNILRKNLESNWEAGEKIDIKFKSKSEFIEFIKQTSFSFKAQNEVEYSIDEKKLIPLKEYILNNVDDLLIERYKDRGIHNFFFNMSFKGLDYEISQIEHLFTKPEFDHNTPGFGEQLDLRSTFLTESVGTFDFIINHHKIYGIDEIKNMFFIKDERQDKSILNSIKYANGFEDFIFKLDENRIRELKHISDENKINLHRIFYRDRHTGDTGRIIYRLHSMGFLVDYTYDYNIKIYNCTFIKYNSIDSYIKIIENYLRRYLSENAAIEAIETLKKRLILKEESLVDDIIESLYYIAEFSYHEIVDKRKRATDDIEDTLLKMNAIEGNDFEKNCFLKGEIYFYFNAKFARPGFRINGLDCSLLDDHKKYRDNDFKAIDLILKYLNDDILKSGTEQNNYKHLIGSCKKIMQSLAETDLKNEWVLRLIKAFAMYATNNISYRSEANIELENGFINLFNDTKYHINDFKKINTIFENYFKSLTANINPENESFLDIDLIKNKLLQQLQFKGIEELITAFNKYDNVI